MWDNSYHSAFSVFLLEKWGKCPQAIVSLDTILSITLYCSRTFSFLTLSAGMRSEGSCFSPSPHMPAGITPQLCFLS